MSHSIDTLPSSVRLVTSKQATFLLYFTGTLIDLVVLNLFAEYWQHVVIDSFFLSLFAALVLQLMLKLTIKIEHATAAYFNSKNHNFARFMRFFSAWLILFSSKFIILYVINLIFGEAISFGGPLHGVVAFIAVVVAMLAMEEVIIRFYRWLGRDEYAALVD